jgi:general secretion pathway protein K
MRQPTCPRPGQRGFVLLVVLWTVAMLALMGSHITAAARGAMARAGALRAGAEAAATADGLLAEAMFRLLDSSPRHWTADGLPRRIGLPRGQGEVLITSEAGRINPSFATVPLMLALLRAVGAPAAQATPLANAINEWHLLGDANPVPYLAARLPYLPPGGKFLDVGELGLVAGMTPDLLDRLAPHLTVQSDGRIDPAAADPLVARVLQAVGADQRLQLPDAGGPVLVRIAAHAVLPGGEARREAVVRIDLTEDEPGSVCVMLAWQ